MKNKDTGIIFEIHRFSLNDGPGIRTTIFLKGCPLHCAWCHNPESQEYLPQLSFNPDKCTHCFECVKACPSNAHLIKDNKHVINWDLCTGNFNCVTSCSYDALKIVGYSAAVEDIISVVKRDKEYYQNTGGGITISGGEPLAQFDFTYALLSAARKENIHTCVDTCGVGKQSHYKSLLGVTDLFLFDYKLTDSVKHKVLTGSGNETILDNLDFIYKNNGSIILRFLLIPGINDNDEHLDGILKLLEKYPEISGEIMPYHSMGKAKAEQIGKEYKLNNIPDSSEYDKEKWMKYFNSKLMNMDRIHINS